MSETEYYSGTMKQVFTEMNIEEACKTALNKMGYDQLDEYHSTWVSMMEENGCDMYYVGDGKLYHIIFANSDPYEDIFEAKQNEDGDILFTLRYYNGGCGFSEAMAYAMAKIGDKP